MTKYLRISILVKPQLLSAKPQHFSTPLSLNPQFVLLFLVISLSSYFFVGRSCWRGASGGAACEASGRWCVLHVNHQMFLKRATGGGAGGRAGCNSRQSGLITTGAWMPSGALGADSRSGTHLDSKTVPGKK